MCKFCRVSIELGRKEALEAIVVLGNSILERHEAGLEIEPEAYFRGVMERMNEHFESMVKQFRKDGYTACPMMRNRA